MSKHYAQRITPILTEIEDSLWKIDARDTTEAYDYPPEAFRAALKLFMSVSMDKLWDNQEKHELPLETRKQQAQDYGEALSNLVQQHLGVDTTELYKKEGQP